MYEPDLWSMYGQQQQQQYPGHPLQQQLPFQHPSYQQPSLYDACLVVPGTSAVSPIAAESSPRCCWSRDEDKAFENALVRFPEDAPDRWDCVAAMVPGKSAAEVAQHFEALVQDVDDIETGRIRFPEYFDEDEDPESPTGCGGRRGGGGNKSKEERKKGVPWTEDEHRRFLDGLQKYGKGDWRSISRNSVVTRTPTQVASHAQKYFLRLNSIGRKEKKRGSIHDITEP